MLLGNEIDQLATFLNYHTNEKLEDIMLEFYKEQCELHRSQLENVLAILAMAPSFAFLLHLGNGFVINRKGIILQASSK